MALSGNERYLGGHQVADLDGRQVVVLAAGSGGAGTTVDTELPAAAALGDGAANPTTPSVGALGLVFNGTSGQWDRLRVANADGQGAAGWAASTNGLYNEASWDRQRAASAAAQSAATKTGITAVALVGNWALTHVPATATKATISKSAGAAGVRHICTGLTVTYAAGASAITAAAPLRVDLIDGASGGTTYLWQSYINVPATAAQGFTIALSGLSLVGTAATAMTLEFSAAGGTNSYESVSLMGYSVA